MVRKTINRNSFNEKLLHRYLLESYYLKTPALVRLLLPDAYHARRLNLVVPEMDTGQGYRMDLGLHFRMSDAAETQLVPVEVKWRASQATRANQLDYLRDMGGFVVSLSQGLKELPSGIPHISIDPLDFQRWLSTNSRRLSDELLVDQGVVAPQRQDWLLVLRGSAAVNFKRMLERLDGGGVAPHTRPFWAFRNSARTMEQLLTVRPEDRLTVVWGTIPGSQRLPNDERTRARSMTVSGACQATIANPYFMVSDPDDLLGTFFESGHPEIGDRRWPHFLDFEIDERLGASRLSPLGRFGEAFADSVNSGDGGLARISASMAGELVETLRWNSAP